jgi:PAS domain S-box-containing protein
LLAGETLYDLESRRLTQWGRVIDVAVSAAPLRGHRGEVTGIVAHLCDITAYKQAERARAESETLYQAVFESSPDAITISRLEDGRYIAVNQSFCQTTGYTREEVVGRTSLELNLFVNPQDRKDLERRLRQKGVVTGMEIRFRMKDGRILDTLLAARRFRYQDEECLVAVVKDISESKRLARERAELEAQLFQAQKLEALGVLAAGVAHDFNNLLQAAGGYLYLLGLERDPQRAARYREQIGQILQRGGDLVHRLLTFGRKVEPQYRRLDLNQVVRQALALLERTIPKMIAIETRLSPDLPPLRGDPAQLEQVLVNLVTNAIDALEDGGRLVISTAAVELEEGYASSQHDAESGTYLLLMVKDTGCGMDPQTRRRIFEPFFTTKEPGRGSGLGLSTVYGIVRAHGGHVICESEPGQGTTFWVYLPVTRAGAEEETSTAPQKTRREQTSGHGETILVVDDEPAILESVQTALQQAGYQALVASSGEQALELYARRGQDIDLVLLDLGMPGMGGLRCLKELRRMDPEAKVVITSGYFAEGLAAKLRQAGAAAYLLKPYRMDQMLEKIREGLGAE